MKEKRDENGISFFTLDKMKDRGKKKMSIPQNTQIITYLPAQLHKGKEFYIDYYICRPGCSNLQRKKIKLNKIRKKTTASEFDRYCRILVKELNEKLAFGWNPFTEQEAAKGYTLLFDALETYWNDKSREMTKNSRRSYKSFLTMLKEWITGTVGDKIFSINFDQAKAREFMQYCWLEKKISGKTYNGYIRAYHSIWAWMVEFGYSKVNVFEGISRKKEKTKKRAEISPELRERIHQYLLENNDAPFWLMCELCYYCLIRPTEMLQIKTKNVNIDKQIIILESGETKNQNERVSSIPIHILPLLAEQIRSSVGKYLFSRENWLPGNEEIDAREITRKWSKLRATLKIPANIQFYSQRDSGIIFLMDQGINPEYVRSQADHYSLEMTTKYSNHYRPEGIEAIKNLVVKNKIMV